MGQQEPSLQDRRSLGKACGEIRASLGEYQEFLKDFQKNFQDAEEDKQKQLITEAKQKLQSVIQQLRGIPGAQDNPNVAAALQELSQLQVTDAASASDALPKVQQAQQVAQAAEGEAIQQTLVGAVEGICSVALAFHNSPAGKEITAAFRQLSHHVLQPGPEHTLVALSPNMIPGREPSVRV